MFGPPFALVDSLSFVEMYEEIFERQIYRFIADSESPFIIDCGANIGVSVLYLKRLYPQSRLLAFEPDPGLFGVLQQNTGTMGLCGVTLVDRAVWDSESTVDFYTEDSYAGTMAHRQPGKAPIAVRTVRLKDCLDQRVDFLKLDIEGSETAVLSDCADRLDRVENLFVEYHSFADRPQTLSTLVSILQGAGFRLHVQSPSPSPQPFVLRECHYDMDLQLNVFAFRR